MQTELHRELTDEEIQAQLAAYSNPPPFTTEELRALHRELCRHASSSVWAHSWLCFSKDKVDECALCKWQFRRLQRQIAFVRELVQHRGDEP